MERSHSNLCCLSGYKSREAALGRPRLYFLQLLFVCARAHMRVCERGRKCLLVFSWFGKMRVRSLCEPPSLSYVWPTLSVPCFHCFHWSVFVIPVGSGWRDGKKSRGRERNRDGEEGLKCSHCFYIMVLALARSISCPGRPDITHTLTHSLSPPLLTNKASWMLSPWRPPPLDFTRDCDDEEGWWRL